MAPSTRQKQDEQRPRVLTPQERKSKMEIEARESELRNRRRPGFAGKLAILSHNVMLAGHISDEVAMFIGDYNQLQHTPENFQLAMRCA